MKQRAIQGLRSRFDAKWVPEPNSGCWLWTAAVMENGYGHLGRDRGINSGSGLAHRIAYELYRGPIADGLTIDHLCRTRCCVNPWHLEPVTIKTNLLRGDSISTQHARRTHCPQGHPYDESNTYWHKGWRQCRTCRQRVDRSKSKKARASLHEL